MKSFTMQRVWAVDQWGKWTITTTLQDGKFFSEVSINEKVFFESNLVDTHKQATDIALIVCNGVDKSAEGWGFGPSTLLDVFDYQRRMN